MIRTKKEYENTQATLEKLRAGLEAQRVQFTEPSHRPTADNHRRRARGMQERSLRRFELPFDPELVE